MLILIKRKLEKKRRRRWKIGNSRTTFFLSRPWCEDRERERFEGEERLVFLERESFEE